MPNSHYEKFILTGEVKCIDDEIPFDLPKGWEWCRLGDVGDWGAGATPLRSNPEFFGGHIPWLKTGELNYDVIFETEEYITEKALQECSLRLCSQGDILIAMYGATIGKLGIAGIELTSNQACCACTPILFYNMFLFYYLMASKQVFVEQGEGGAQPNISRIKLVSHLFPMPPLAEQQRIVAKIEELMPLIEQYGKAQSELEALNNNIREQLKKSVLQYAIEGKLVPQCEEDSTAEDLLAEIQVEKQRLYAEGKLKKKDLSHSIIFRGEDNKYYEQIGNEVFDITEEVPYDLPNDWSFCRLSVLCWLDDGKKHFDETLPYLDAKYQRGHSLPSYVQMGRLVEAQTKVILVDGENSGEVFITKERGYLGSTFKVLQCMPQVSATWIQYILENYRPLLKGSKIGAAIPHLNKKLFHNLIIGLPCRKEHKLIAKQLYSIFQLIEG